MKDRIKIGQIKPSGWLRSELDANMRGCIGNLDMLAPTVVRDHDIYGSERLKKGDGIRNSLPLSGDVNETPTTEDIAFYQWWDSESQSNWRDGYVRSAIMLGTEAYLKKVRTYVDRILSTQDEDGYLGIYDKELRYHFVSENGELWAQSSLFRGLLACYEGLNDAVILEKVKRAVACTMKNYPINACHPFNLINPKGGTGHGLTIVDTFGWLFDITGDQSYLDYAVWLYEEYSKYPMMHSDMQIDSLRKPFSLFQAHAVHTFEHMRAVVYAAIAKEEYIDLIDKLTCKLPYYLAPSGGPIGDERILGRCADATWTGYECCTIQECLHTYSLLSEKTGDVMWNDLIEWLYFNAGEGLKHPTDSAIMYLKTDNCYIADGHKHPDDTVFNASYSYSPTHLKTAVCCVPNLGRMTPYFIQSLLCETEKGYNAYGYAPYVYKGFYRGNSVQIRMETQYPKTLTAQLHVSATGNAAFDIQLRMPSWATRMTVNGEVYDNPDGHCRVITLNRVWKEDAIDIAFETGIQFRKDLKGDVYVTYGPILYVLPIKAVSETTHQYNLPGFRDVNYTPIDRYTEKLRLKNDDFDTFRVLSLEKDVWWEDLRIEGIFTDALGAKYKLNMRPMARTILRKATFAV